MTLLQWRRVRVSRAHDETRNQPFRIVGKLVLIKKTTFLFIHYVSIKLKVIDKLDILVSFDIN